MSSHYFDRLAWWQQLATLFAQKPEQKHNESMPPGYISVEEAARRLGKSEQAVRNLCQRGRIYGREDQRRVAHRRGSPRNFRSSKARKTT